MSWDIVLFSFKSKEKISSIEEIDESKFTPVDFRAILTSHFKNVTDLDGLLRFSGENYSIDYYCGDDGPEGNIILHLYGEAALYEMIPLAIKYNWQIYDTGSGEMIDLDNPAKNGYKDFQSYLSRVINRTKS